MWLLKGMVYGLHGHFAGGKADTLASVVVGSRSSIVRKGMKHASRVRFYCCSSGFGRHEFVVVVAVMRAAVACVTEPI